MLPNEAYDLFIGVFVFLMGLCVGSFLNVCIYRIPLEKSVVLPSSHCPACGHKLSPLDLIPVISHLLLKGKCRYCKERISIRYTLVEILTGIVWLLVYSHFGLSVEALAFVYLFSILIAVFFIDLEHMIIPNELVIAASAGGLLVIVYNMVTPFSVFEPAHWATPLIGMVSSSGILFLVALIGLLIYKNDGAMGMGDVKLFIPIGMFLGWKLSLLALFISIMGGGIISILLLLFKIKDRKSAIPFGPFIILGTMVAALYGNKLLEWYFML